VNPAFQADRAGWWDLLTATRAESWSACTRRGELMLDSFYEIDIPDALRGVATRHQRHVGELVSSLRAFGVDDQIIERSVDQLMGSYRAELVTAIKTLKRPCHA
jgi:hypothetical protein